jgi:drug/metabolite transporter (DMT)-like permease
MHDRGAAIRRYLGSGAVPLFRAVLGYFMFGDKPDGMMLLGASIIVSSGLYAFYRERVRARPVAATTSGIPPDGL